MFGTGNEHCSAIYRLLAKPFITSGHLREKSISVPLSASSASWITGQTIASEARAVNRGPFSLVDLSRKVCAVVLPAVVEGTWFCVGSPTRDRNGGDWVLD